MNSQLIPKGIWGFVCRNPDGSIAWVERIRNAITNQGLNHALDRIFANAAAITPWYIGLIDGASATLAAADTMASHVGWTENTSYDQATRVEFVEAAASGQSISNVASVAVFTISATVTIYGGFLTSVNTKGDATGTLWATGAFSSPQTMVDNQTLEITYTCSAANS
jgi:uncharacterized membrane protein